MISVPYTPEDEPKKLTAEDIQDLKQAFSGHLNSGHYNDARHLMDSVREESPELADELYQLALLGHSVVLD